MSVTGKIFFFTYNKQGFQLDGGTCCYSTVHMWQCLLGTGQTDWFIGQTTLYVEMTESGPLGGVRRVRPLDPPMRRMLHIIITHNSYPPMHVIISLVIALLSIDRNCGYFAV